MLRARSRSTERRAPPEKLLRCYQRMGDYRAVGAEYERTGEWGKAVEAYRRFAESSEPNRKALEDEIPGQPRQRKTMIRSALRLSALGREGEAGPLYRKAGLFEPAARSFQVVEDYEQLAECLSNLGRHREAAAAAEKSNLRDARREELVFLHLERHLRADPRRESRVAVDLEEEADRLLAEGKLVPALVRYRVLGNGAGALEAYIRLGRDEEAILEFLAGGSPALARKYVEAKEINVSADFLRTVARRQDTEEGKLEDGSLRERSPAEGRQMLRALFRKALPRLPRAEAEDLLDECSESGLRISHSARGFHCRLGLASVHEAVQHDRSDGRVHSGGTPWAGRGGPGPRIPAGRGSRSNRRPGAGCLSRPGDRSGPGGGSSLPREPWGAHGGGPRALSDSVSGSRGVSDRPKPG